MKIKKLNKYKSKKHFAQGIDFYKLIWIFAWGSIIGYLIETIWCFISLGYIESRQGVIYGPISPVYGFGAVLFTISTYKIRNKNGIIIFLLSAVLGAAFEYLCSWIQEVSIGTVSWEYSNQPFNLEGRTSLRFALIWGFLGYFFIRRIYPIISSWIERLPNLIGIILTWAVFIFLIFDMGISVLAVRRQTERQNGKLSYNKFDKFLDEKYPDSFLKVIYPNMRAPK